MKKLGSKPRNLTKRRSEVRVGVDHRWGATVLCLSVALVAEGCSSSRPPATSAPETNQSRSTSSAEPCSAKALKMTVGAQGATQGLVATVSLEQVGDSPCNLDSFLHFALRRPDGTLAGRVRGNPSTLRLPEEQVAPDATVTRSWIWRNWCGSRGQLLLTASVGEISGTESATPPACVDETSPSTLVLQDQR
jgi:hypothetical protein